MLHIAQKYVYFDLYQKAQAYNMAKILIEDIQDYLSEIFRTDLEIKDECLQLYIKSVNNKSSSGSLVLSVTKERLEGILTLLEEKKNENSTILYDNKSREILLREEGVSRIPLSHRNGLEFPLIINDETNKVTYTLGQPSDEFLVYLMSEATKSNNSLRRIWGLSYSFLFERALALNESPEGDNSGSPLDLFEALRMISSRIITLRLHFEKPTGSRDLPQSLQESFLFNLSFNLNVSFVPLQSLQELIVRSKVNQIRRMKVSEIDAPRRIYKSSLVHYYQMGVSTDNAQLAFLSYYRIAESFFEEIFNENLIKSVQGRITKANFSYKKKDDVKKLINFVKSQFKIEQESTTLKNEKEALRLTLDAYINVDELRESLESIDSLLLEYYEENEVPFSKGDTLHFFNGDKDFLIKSITNRIYNTRCSIVHSKEDNQSKYIPFKHDADLIQEVPLMRCVSEQLLEATSKRID